MVFSSEVTDPTYVNDRFTPALVEFLKSKERTKGQILIPDDLIRFRHLKKTEITLGCSDMLAISSGIRPAIQ